MTRKVTHLFDEADIGSGEKTPGQEEVERSIESIGKAPKQQPIDGKQHRASEEQQAVNQDIDFPEQGDQSMESKRSPAAK